jgi:sporulation protein YlmC with PRC-barrel domain
MKISWSQLHHLPVQTESGEKLGIVEGVTISIDKHAIEKYEIKPATLLAGFFSQALLISPEQVISITKEKMIVKDSVAPTEVQTNSERTRLASSLSARDQKIYPSETE